MSTPPIQDTPAQELTALLTPMPLSGQRFAGVHPRPATGRGFGGHVAAQALAAAGATVPEGLTPNSVHTFFLNVPANHLPIEYEVATIRDGGRYYSRRVTAWQEGRELATLSASFHQPEASQFGRRMDAVAPSTARPEPAPPPHRAPGAVLEALDLRFVEPDPREPARRQRWFRAAGIGGPPLLHACVLLYQADLWVLDAMLGPLDLRWNDKGMLCGSLDLAMWFHLPPRCDVWTLYDLRSPVMDGSRGFTEGRMYQDGALAATMNQEGIIRVRR